jgi:hypothetical protein
MIRCRKKLRLSDNLADYLSTSSKTKTNERKLFLAEQKSYLLKHNFPLGVLSRFDLSGKGKATAAERKSFEDG